MTDKDEDILADLLIRWEELREQGQDVSSLELCQGCPHLADELEHRINALKVTSWMDKPVDVPAADLDGAKSETHEPRTLVGRYRLDELIAEGGFAQVWRAYDLELHRCVAVKVPKPSRLDSAEAFMAEARRVARLKHPGIVPVHDVGRDNGNVFIVSEFVEGGNLGDHIKRSLISVQQATRWATEIAEALEYAHANGVIHRDIKPANILVDHHGRALLADFGIAQSATKTGRFAPSIGTLRYMAPEQLEGEEADARSDIYSLGVVLCELLTGKLPYSSTEPNVLRQEIVTGAKVGPENMPAELRRICRKALERDPAARYTTAAELAVDLRNLLQDSKGKRLILSLLFVSLVCGLGFIAIWRSNQPSSLQTEPTLQPLDPRWIAQIAELPADEQVKEVIAKLRELNPQFDGNMRSEQLEGAVNLIDCRSDNLTDIRPFAALKGLRFVNLSGSFNWKHNGRLVDISPLKGLPIEEVDIHSTLVEDLSPLENAPLTVLVVNNTNVTDLSSIRHAKLTRLDIHNTGIADLKPIQGMPINNLHMANTQVKDLSPLTGMPINDLQCQYCGFTDIKPLQGMPLHTLEVHGNPITDLSPLADSMICNLNIYKTAITDWSPIKTMPRLRMISFDFEKARDSDILRSVTTLEEINERSVADFWKTVHQPVTYEEAVALGDSYFNSQQYVVASQYYTTAIEFDRSNAKGFFKRGQCHFHAEAFKESQSDFKKAVELEPANAQYHERLANAYFHLRRLDESVVAMEQAVNLNPPEIVQCKKSLAIILSNRAASYAHAEKYSDAIADLDKALELDPDGMFYHRQRAGCYFNNKNLEKALPDFNEAIRREPKNGSYYLNRGYCFQAMGKNDEAAADFDKAKQLENQPGRMN